MELCRPGVPPPVGLPLTVRVLADWACRRRELPPDAAFLPGAGLGERAPAARGDGLLERPLRAEASFALGFGDGERPRADAAFRTSGLRERGRGARALRLERCPESRGRPSPGRRLRECSAAALGLRERSPGRGLGERSCLARGLGGHSSFDLAPLACRLSAALSVESDPRPSALDILRTMPPTGAEIFLLRVWRGESFCRPAGAETGVGTDTLRLEEPVGVFTGGGRSPVGVGAEIFR